MFNELHEHYTILTRYEHLINHPQDVINNRKFVKKQSPTCRAVGRGQSGSRAGVCLRGLATGHTRQKKFVTRLFCGLFCFDTGRDTGRDKGRDTGQDTGRDTDTKIF